MGITDEERFAAARIAQHFTAFNETSFDAEMARSDYPSLMDRAIHEAGRVVVHAHLGLDFHYVTLSPDDDNSLGVVSVQEVAA